MRSRPMRAFCLTLISVGNQGGGQTRGPATGEAPDSSLRKAFQLTLNISFSKIQILAFQKNTLNPQQVSNLTLWLAYRVVL